MDLSEAQPRRELQGADLNGTWEKGGQTELSGSRTKSSCGPLWKDQKRFRHIPCCPCAVQQSHGACVCGPAFGHRRGRPGRPPFARRCLRAVHFAFSHSLCTNLHEVFITTVVSMSQTRRWDLEQLSNWPEDLEPLGGGTKRPQRSH